ncbi:NAD binding Rossmann fold, partial [Cordyceps militaris]
MLAAAHLRNSRKGIQKKDALEQCMWDMIRRRIGPLTKSSAHRITPEQLRAEWNIVVQKLDLDTGRPDHGETFIQPIPIHQIDSWIKEFRPLEYPSRGPYDYDLFDIYDRLEDAGEGKEISRGIFRMVNNYIIRSHLFRGGSILWNKTNWRKCLPTTDRLSFRSEKHNWFVSTVIYQCNPALGNRYISTTLPHLSCFLHDDEMLQDDGSLSHAELNTIMILALQQASDCTYSHATVIPIVVFSCAGRHLRIVQACIDFKHYHFDIRCSEILNFNEGGIRGTDENLRRFYTLLGWVLGEPVGNVEKSQ